MCYFFTTSLFPLGGEGGRGEGGGGGGGWGVKKIMPAVLI